jgi:hypothetical protein
LQLIPDSSYNVPAGNAPTTGNAKLSTVNSSKPADRTVQASIATSSGQGAGWGAGHDAYVENNLLIPVIDTDWTAEL